MLAYHFGLLPVTDELLPEFPEPITLFAADVTTSANARLADIYADRYPRREDAPCVVVVSHLDDWAVWGEYPARCGHHLVAYADGCAIGPIDPTTGQRVLRMWDRPVADAVAMAIHTSIRIAPDIRGSWELAPIWVVTNARDWADQSPVQRTRDITG